MHISIMLVFGSFVRNSVVLAVYLLFSVACFLTVHEHSTRPTQHDQLRLNTPDGELVASVLEQGDYRSIVIDLERNGNSGQVAMVEWASEEVRGPGVEFIYDEGGMVQAVPGSEPLYPTPFHTFAYNGNDDDPTSVVSLDPDGREMFYLPRGRDRDAIRGNEPLSTQATRASSLGGRTGAAPSRHGELQAPTIG